MTTTILIVGAGFTGTILALKLARARPDDRIVLIEKARRAGPGLAYGACHPQHLLNVPVSRMECGLTPGFGEWLSGCGADLAPMLDEADGRLADAFAPRALFGRYLEEQLASALSADPERGVQRLTGNAVRLADPPTRAVVLEDGREIEGDLIVLATGNLAPHPGPTAMAQALGGDAVEVVADPWAPDAFDGLDRDAGVLLIGAGLTMVDVVLKLAWTGHRGPVTAVSRHGRAPLAHVRGGAWPGFLNPAAAPKPLAALWLIRAQVAAAQAAGVPWQRVFDAARPDVARVWRSWSLASRRRFLRHLRTLWDVHRHRMAPQVAEQMQALVATGRLTLHAGRMTAVERSRDAGMVRLALRGGGEAVVGPVARIVNCTGPRTDFDRLETPLYGHLRRAGLVQGDELGLGIATRSCAVIGADGEPSPWLFAVGGLTRPSLWEVTAAPEINAQVDALVASLSQSAPTPALDLVFADLGAGI